MSFDITTAKARLGIVGTAQDTIIQVCMDTAKAIAEKHLDRMFDYAVETAKFYDFHGKQIHLHRYPIETVGSVSEPSSSSVAASDYKVHATGGYIEFFHQRYFREVDVTYSAGYRTLPADLILGLWLIFDAVWNATPGGGATIGGATTSGALGALKSIETPDVGRLVFETSASSSASASVGACASRFLGADAINLLAPYRRIDA
jgi:hypothetical protein